MNINTYAKALVFVKGTWKFVLGQQNSNSDFIYIDNGRMERAEDGNYRRLDSDTTDRDAHNEAIRLNLYHLTRLYKFR